MNKAATDTFQDLRSNTAPFVLSAPHALRAVRKSLFDTFPYLATLSSRIGIHRPYHAPVLFFLARQYQLAYLQMPKVACTSIKTTLCLLNRPELAAEIEKGSLRINTQPNLSDVIRNDSPELSGYFRFTFVRNPCARFLSFYSSKIVGKANQGPVRRFRGLGYTPGMTIDEVLDKVESTPSHLLDSHLLPQSAFLVRDGKLRVDFIGRIERFSHDLTLVSAWAGAKFNVGHLNKTKNIRSEDADRMLTKGQKRRIARLYAKDFELLGYDI